MKISENWLRQFVNPTLTTQELAEQFAMLGLTIDAVIPVAGKFSNVVVGEIVTRIQHPNADKLSCCEVNVGEKTLLKIVCGAPNARAGIKVVVAKIGAILPGDFHIKEAKLRGELSQGMLCSAKELQLELGKVEQEGIIELPMDAKIGEDFHTYFQAQDHILDVEITPNRGDCLSAIGLARDLATAIQSTMQTPDLKTIPAATQESFPIQVVAQKECPRYVGRVISNINLNAQTPSYMQHRLQRANVRLIHPVVDVCNYVMLELGQPMHAFDLSTLKNQLQVRFAKHQEKIKLLDDCEITLSENDLVIADSEKPHALAGIMGGLESGVSAQTKDIFLEAAFFDPKIICLSKRRHNISSDACYRFERGVDFELPVAAIERATQLLLDIVGGQAGKINEVVSKEHLPKRENITLATTEIKRILGIDIPDEKIKTIFTALGFSHSHSGSCFTVTPPSFRFDIAQPIDLIEELARMMNYNTIPKQPMIAPLTMHAKTEARVCDKTLRQFLVARGYHEAMTYSFISPKLHELFFKDSAQIALKNPLSQDLSVMRHSILPGLVQALQMNVRHQSERVRLFEMGMCFAQSDSTLLQVNRLALAMIGSQYPEQWAEKTRESDFYDLKGDVNALLSLSHVYSDYEWKAEAHPILHPGRSMILYRDQKQVGFFGQLHPEILSYFDLRQTILVGEFDLKLIQASSVAQFESFSKFPSVRRDLAIVVDQSITAEQIRAAITQKASKELVDLHIFDVYQGKGIETGKKSIALGLTFQDPTRTLIDEEIHSIIQGVVSNLESELNATLRE